jgi:hypothetical protein
MYDATVGPLLTAQDAYASTMKRMPAIMDLDFLPDMGRMTA